MFKKAYDKMFRKAQTRLFTMIVSILLAVFIALIGSINLITKSVMRGQSKEVLMQIAAGIEYNDKEAEFNFTPPAGKDNKTDKKDNSSQKPTVGTAPVTTEKDTTSPPTTDEKVTDAPTTAPETTHQPAEEHNGGNEAPREEYPQEEQPAETQPPATDAPPAPQIPTFDPNYEWWNNGGAGGYDPWANGWGDPWNHGGGQGGQGNQDGQWGDQWNQGGQDGQWNNGEWDPNNQWGNYWYNPWNPWNPWNTWSFGEYPTAQSKEESFERNDHGEHDPRYESTDVQKDMSSSYSDEAVGGIVPLAGRNEADAMAADGAQKNAPYSSRANYMMSDPKAEPIPRSLGSIDFFVIMADVNGKYLATLNNEEMNAEKAQRYITAILDKHIDTGMVNSYQFYQTDKKNGTIMVFTDKSYEMDMLRQLKRTTIIIGSIALVILSVLAYFLSKKSIQPIRTAFNKQKQFVSDASHELKTPLTVISANADVLEGEIGENKWLKYIQAQTDRMSVLVNDLLNLTRLENNTTGLERKYFNLSKAIVNTALPFECQAFESNKKFEVNVDEDVMLSGSEQHIKQMVAIFIDNALKYSNDGGTVRVALKKSGDKKIFSVYNTGEGIKEGETDKIFERFYRSDQSRNRATGGYGLGLAIAKSIIDKHKFKTHVINQPGKSVCFIVTM